MIFWLKKNFISIDLNKSEIRIFEKLPMTQANDSSKSLKIILGLFRAFENSLRNLKEFDKIKNNFY
jgi:hypothetical protein